MAHQNPPYLAFFTPGQKEIKNKIQGYLRETDKTFTYFSINIKEWKKWVTSNMKRSKESRYSWKSSKQPNHGKIVSSSIMKSDKASQDIHSISQVSSLLFTLEAPMKTNST